MLQTIIIGHLGADAEVKSANGREFVTFRIANTDKWTDDAGQVHEQTTWVDCIMNGRPKVADYLKKGIQVYAAGSVSLRVYSSAKDRCMKAGITINVRSVELLGGKSDEVPGVLYRTDNQQECHVSKYYFSPECLREDPSNSPLNLVSKSGENFIASCQGWITKATKTE